MERTRTVPPSVADDLPQSVWSDVARLPEQLQAEFVREYRDNAKSERTAFLLWLLGLHHAYLSKDRRLLALFWLLTLPVLLWWAVDGLRLAGMVRDYNYRLARDVLHYMRTIAS